MRVALRFTSAFRQPLVDGAGDLIPGDSGRYLLRRLVGVFDDPIVVSDGDESRRCNGFDLKPLRRVDPNRTVVVTFDVLDAMSLYQQMKTWVGAFPKLVNFVWWNVSEFPDRESKAIIGASAGLFPTFCNSGRTEQEIRDQVNRWCSGAVARSARLAHCPLGIDVDADPLPRADDDRGTVLYPAMWTFARKNPQVFLEVATKVAAATGCRVRAALSEHNVNGGMAMEFRRAGFEVSGLVPRDEYRPALARDTAFLATAQDESYGLAYVEAMYAGVVGVFPNRPWVWSILPPQYPFVYGSQSDAEAMLHYVVREREAARRLVADVPRWIREHHDRRRFDARIREQVAEWWPDRG